MSFFLGSPSGTCCRLFCLRFSLPSGAVRAAARDPRTPVRSQNLIIPSNEDLSVVLGNSGTSFPVTFADVEISQSAVSPGDSTVVCRGRPVRRTYSEPLMTRSGARSPYGHSSPTGASSEMRDLRGAPLVSVMQPAQHRYRYDPARLWRLDRIGAPEYLSPMPSERGSDGNIPRMPGGAGADFAR